MIEVAYTLAGGLVVLEGFSIGVRALLRLFGKVV